jgi:hypothetical protein
VGRYLWRTDQCKHQWKLLEPPPRPQTVWSSDLDQLVWITRDKRNMRQEFCIGPGAHVHYLDETAPEIAAAIDALLNQAIIDTHDCQPPTEMHDSSRQQPDGVET